MATKSTSVKTAAGLVSASRSAYSQKWSFLVLSAFMFVVSTSVAAKYDLLPETQVASVDMPLVLAPATPVTAPELPTKIEIPTIGLSQPIANPESTSVEVLDNALLKGAVRYPSSSKLGVSGNVIIFGHSSYLPIVNNKAFKAFDDIQKLSEGDRIMVTGEDHVFIYEVETVEKKSALNDAIPLGVDGSKLTLATCNSFGEKSDRFIVTATLVETTSL